MFNRIKRLWDEATRPQQPIEPQLFDIVYLKPDRISEDTIPGWLGTLWQVEGGMAAVIWSYDGQVTWVRYDDLEVSVQDTARFRRY